MRGDNRRWSPVRGDQNADVGDGERNSKRERAFDPDRGIRLASEHHVELVDAEENRANDEGRYERAAQMRRVTDDGKCLTEVAPHRRRRVRELLAALPTVEVGARVWVAM